MIRTSNINRSKFSDHPIFPLKVMSFFSLLPFPHLIFPLIFELDVLNAHLLIYLD
jgi:hypothetical protein